MAAPMDLNILWTDKITSISSSLQTAIKLGYEAVAINYVIEDLLKCDKNKKKRGSVEAVVEIKKPNQIRVPDTEFEKTKSRAQKCEQYTRFSTIINTIDQTYRIQRSGEVQAFDLVAVTPTSEKTWQQACLNLDVDIISLDLTEKLPFNLKRQQINTAIERGVHFEICYTPAIRDTTARRYIISNAQSLVNVCKGNNIIISGASEKPIDLRAPNDVANLGELFGLNAVQSKAAVTTNCKAAILHGQARKTSNSIITISKSSDLTSTQHQSLSTLRKLNKEIENISENNDEDKRPPKKKPKVTQN